MIEATAMFPASPTNLILQAYHRGLEDAAKMLTEDKTVVDLPVYREGALSLANKTWEIARIMAKEDL